MIPDIKQLSPAELLFLQQPNRLYGRQMMRVTLLDLIMKEVLQIHTLVDGATKPVYYLTPGQYFSQYPPLVHEEPFLIPFQTGEQKVELTLLINLVAQKTKSYYGYQYNFVRKTPKIQSIMQPSFWNAFHSFPLTQEGKELRKDLKQRLLEGEQIVAASLRQTQSDLAQLPFLLGSGLLLIGNLEQTLAGGTYTESWLNELTSAYEPLALLFNRKSDEAAASGCGAFAGVSDSFGGCGSGGCSGSGCSGGGGCSGGSGCGGGGCGGGGCGGG